MAVRHIKLVYVLATEDIDDDAIDMLGEELATEMEAHLLEGEVLVFTGSQDLTKLKPKDKQRLTEIFNSSVKAVTEDG